MNKDDNRYFIKKSKYKYHAFKEENHCINVKLGVVLIRWPGNRTLMLAFRPSVCHVYNLHLESLSM